MPANTPPKGRPTVGKLDYKEATRRAKRRGRRARIIWITVGVVALAAILIWGTINNDSGGTGTTTPTGGSGSVNRIAVSFPS